MTSGIARNRQAVRDQADGPMSIDDITTGLRRISTANFVILIIIALGLTYVFNVDNSQGVFFFVSYVLSLGVAFSVVFVPIRLIYIPIAAVVMLMPDLTQTAAQIDVLGKLMSASIWQLRAGPLTPAVLVFICLSIALFRMSLVSTLRLYRVALFYFLGIAIIVSVLYGYPQQSMPRFISDFKVAILLYFSLLLFDAYFRTFPEETFRVMQVFLAFLVAAVIFPGLKMLVSPRASELGFNFVHSSLDSAKGLTLAIVFLAIAKIGQGTRIMFWTLIGSLALYLVVSYQTRWLIVTFLLGLLIVYLAYPLKRQLRLSVWLIPIMGLGLGVLIASESEILRVMLLRFAFVSELATGGNVMEFEVVRTSSIVNSVHHLWEKKALLTGLGYGSWFTDGFIPMPNLTTGAFDEESLLSGRYYRVHDFLFHFLFKFGLIGLLVYVGLFLGPLRQLWVARYRIMARGGGAELLIVLFGIAPTVVTYMWFSGKGNIFCGFYIALCAAWVRILGEAPAPDPNRHFRYRKDDSYVKSA